MYVVGGKITFDPLSVYKLDPTASHFHMQHVSTIEVSKASTLVSWVYDIEKSGNVTGVGKGYGKKSGPGVGGSCTAGGGPTPFIVISPSRNMASYETTLNDDPPVPALP
jgi:hypothetical protein